MTHRRRFSSEQVVNALRRAGFELVRSQGSHGFMAKSRPDGTYLTTTVVLGRHELKEPTLQGILDDIGMTYEQFLKYARVKDKSRK